MPKEFVLPDLGEGIAEAQIVRLLIKEGDRIDADQYLMEVETDKAAVEIPSPFAGVASKIHVKEGQTVNVGDVIVTFDDGKAEGQGPAAAPAKAGKAAGQSAHRTEDAKAASRPEKGQAAEQPQQGAPQAAPTAPPERGKTIAPAAPAIRKMAREMGLDIDQVEGSGPGGRVTQEDLERAASQSAAKSGVKSGAASGARPQPAGAPPPRAAAPTPSVRIPGTADQDKWGRIYREPINQIRKTIANQMKRSAYTAPHVTHCDEADITELDKMRRDLNEATGDDPKLTVMGFIIRATCIALRKFPIFNSSYDEENGQIVYKDYVNLGVAVDTERGLIVPVIRDADRLTLRGIAAALRTIAERVRSNQFAVEDLRGGSFTITNVGALGGTFSTPIINFPEVAIFGLGRSRKTPTLRNGQLAEALMIPLNLSFDHRAADGANAARFTREIISYLETPAKFLLD